MSQLLSMLVPLETLAGWPTVKDPTPLQSLGLLIGLPLLVIIIVSVLVTARERSTIRGANNKYTDPTWVGAEAGQDEILGADNAAGQAALQGGPAADLQGTATSVDDTGGASARW